MANIADSLYLKKWEAALTSFLMVLSFIFGAAHSSWTILWAKRHRFRSSDSGSSDQADWYPRKTDSGESVGERS